MPPNSKNGSPPVTAGSRPNASQSAITTASITRSPIKGRQQRAARRREAVTARVSLLVTDVHRTWWHYLVRCPVCGRPHIGRSRELAGVTGTRRLPCGHWIIVVVARSYGQSSPGAAA